MYFLSKMGLFHCYVSLPEGTTKIKVVGTGAKKNQIDATEFFPGCYNNQLQKNRR